MRIWYLCLCRCYAPQNSIRSWLCDSWRNVFYNRYSIVSYSIHPNTHSLASVSLHFGHEQSEMFRWIFVCWCAHMPKYRCDTWFFGLSSSSPPSFSNQSHCHFDNLFFGATTFIAQQRQSKREKPLAKCTHRSIALSFNQNYSSRWASSTQFNNFAFCAFFPTDFDFVHFYPNFAVVSVFFFRSFIFFF